MQFRKATKNDIIKVEKIEKDLFNTESWIRDCLTNNKTIYEVWILEDKEIVISYLCGFQVVDEFSITNIATTKSFQKKGYAYKAILNLTEKLIKRNVKYIFLEVRKSNTAAINLYSKLKFKKISIRKKYYTNPTEDAIIMALYI